MKHRPIPAPFWHFVPKNTTTSSFAFFDILVLNTRKSLNHSNSIYIYTPLCDFFKWQFKHLHYHRYVNCYKFIIRDPLATVQALLIRYYCFPYPAVTMVNLIRFFRSNKSSHPFVNRVLHLKWHFKRLTLNLDSAQNKFVGGETSIYLSFTSFLCLSFIHPFSCFILPLFELAFVKLLPYMYICGCVTKRLVC